MKTQFEIWWAQHEGSKVQPPVMSLALKELAESAWNAAKNSSTGNIWIVTIPLKELATLVNLNDNYLNSVRVITHKTKEIITGYNCNEARFSTTENSIDLLTNMSLEVEIWGK